MTADVIARLYDEHAPALRRYLARRIGPETADDLVAETFLTAMTRHAGYDPERAPIRPWLYGIATNLLRRHLRQERRRYQATARLAARNLPGANHDGLVADRVDADARVRALAAALATLSGPDLDVLLLTSWAGLDSNEVGEAQGIPVGTVRSRLHRVRKSLRTCQGGSDAPTVD
ncbi:RNA polymerase sigma factor [Kutzneria kofuensis]|uniref:RNA polymerase sigma-70 factor (ECF subfamily) n=1 Tax=Kutzneria kofuensis TaxID=103725 RepID=A0A7W9NHL0_9PSEU|nr:sigma-70 family RNA polymerase sigma factor [Kutzneria kofuensis]MBB5892238.1 RNA polymerase sigma-70 factor (ECF subfamily) [Kutzneria kofuensis]